MLRTNLPPDLRALVDDCRYAVIATSDASGRALATPLAVNFDDELRMYWASAYGSQHSLNLAGSPLMTAVIFGDQRSKFEGQGLYMEMSVDMLGQKSEIQDASRFYDATLFETHHPGITFLDDCPTRLYRARPTRLWRNHNGLYRGYYVDVRRDLNIIDS